MICVVSGSDACCLRDVLVAVDGDDAVRVFLGGEALRLEDRAERDVPWLVADFGGTLPVTPLPTTMVRPEKTAKAAMTSRMSAS